MAEITREQAEDSPERLKARREALGLSHVDAANLPGLDLYTARDIAHWEVHSGVPGADRYAAALSAEEQLRADVGPVTHLIRDGVGIWPGFGEPPAPEVVDVPQPVRVEKRCAGLTMTWMSDCVPHTCEVASEHPGTVALHVPLALLRAMLAAIDAQQPDPQPDLDEGWRVVTGDTAFAMPFGTIRECGGCGCLVSGGPTACRRCADAPGPQPADEPERPEPRYKVGDWVRVTAGQRRGDVFRVAEVDWYARGGEWRIRRAVGDAPSEFSESELSPALDPALHETARKTIAWLRGAGDPSYLRECEALPGWQAWVDAVDAERHARWAAQLERLLGEASHG